jgi:hypothetical protein
MAKGQRKSNREAKKPKKTAAERSKSAAILISNQAPGTSYQDRVKKGASLMASPLARRECRHG